MICRFAHQHPLLPKSFTLLLGAGFVLLVFQWEFLQMGMWMTMFRTYTAETTLQQAVADTFSGEKPCDMCTKLVRSQTQTDSEDVVTSPSSFPPDLTAPESFIVRSPRLDIYQSPSSSRPSRTTLRPAPPSPPPRFFLS